MSFHYAQIDLETKVCFADSWLSGTVDRPDMILLPEDITDTYLGKIYENGVWSDPPEEPETTEEETTS